MAELFEGETAKAVSFAAKGASQLSLPFMMTGFVVKAFIELVKAHEAGDQQAVAANYAQTWAEIVANRLYNGTLQECRDAGIPALNAARQRAQQDAFAMLIALNQSGDQLAELAAAMKKQYGNEGNAKRALETELMSRAGYEGLKF